LAIGLAGVASIATASFAQASRGPDRGETAGTGIEAVEPKKHGELSDGPRTDAEEPTGVFVAAPIGRVGVGPELVEGEPIYLRRTPVRQGITIVELSTTPFQVEAVAFEGWLARPDQPAGW
jgi:hypothetical protein